ncbi:MAG: hypothetical protein NTV93_20125 [Verrucomicrobia bacterium]|nr:hypothetical protein [Verrucomicrobiota bacterium]
MNDVGHDTPALMGGLANSKFYRKALAPKTAKSFGPQAKSPQCYTGVKTDPLIGRMYPADDWAGLEKRLAPSSLKRPT